MRFRTFFLGITSYSYLFLLIVLSACRNNEEKGVPVLQVQKSHFDHVIKLQGYTEPVNSQIMYAPRNIRVEVEYLAEDGSYVEAGEVVCRLKSSVLQIEYDEWVLNCHDARARLQKREAEFVMQHALLEAEVKTNEAESQIAFLDSLQMKYTSPNQRKIKELELRITELQRKKFEHKLKSNRLIQQTELKQLRLVVRQYENRIKKAQDRLAQLVITSPRKGLAIRPINWRTDKKLQVGDELRGNAPVLTLPELDRMKIVMKVAESDFKQIRENDSVYYHFGAMPGNSGWGRITAKSPMGIPFNDEESSLLKYYEVEASVDSVSTALSPGFTADCYVYLRQVRDTLVIPQIAIFDRDSVKVVYVKKKKYFEMRQVRTGMNTLDRAIIREGILPGEIIALAKPPADLVRKEVFLTGEKNEYLK